MTDTRAVIDHDCLASTITFKVFPPEGHRFGADAFTGAIGHRVALIGHPSAWLRQATVTDDGTVAELTVDTGPKQAFGTFRSRSGW